MATLCDASASGGRAEEGGEEPSRLLLVMEVGAVSGVFLAGRQRYPINEGSCSSLAVLQTSFPPSSVAGSLPPDLTPAPASQRLLCDAAQPPALDRVGLVGAAVVY